MNFTLFAVPRASCLAWMSLAFVLLTLCCSGESLPLETQAALTVLRRAATERNLSPLLEGIRREDIVVLHACGEEMYKARLTAFEQAPVWREFLVSHPTWGLTEEDYRYEMGQKAVQGYLCLFLKSMLGEEIKSTHIFTPQERAEFAKRLDSALAKQSPPKIGVGEKNISPPTPKAADDSDGGNAKRSAAPVTETTPPRGYPLQP